MQAEGTAVPAGATAGPGRWRGVRAVGSMVVLPLLGLAVAIGLWWGAKEAFDIPRISLPYPLEVLVEIGDRPRVLWENGRVTLYESVAGFAAGSATGLVLGTAIAHSRILSQMTYPWLVAFNAIPKIALAPLLVIWMGFGTEPKIAMAVLLCFFPVVLATTSGLTSTPTELVELARSLDASRWQTFTKVRFPYALPQIFVGLKLAMPLAVIGAVIGEFSAGQDGLGVIVKQAGGLGNSPLAFAALVALSMMGIGLYYAVVGVERLLLPWVRATTA
jgi:NitT/TauT family transport system permease protein